MSNIYLFSRHLFINSKYTIKKNQFLVYKSGAFERQKNLKILEEYATIFYVQPMPKGQSVV